MSSDSKLLQSGNNSVKDNIIALIIRLNELRAPLHDYEEVTEFMMSIKDHRDAERAAQYERIRQELIRIRESGVVSPEWFDRQYELYRQPYGL